MGISVPETEGGIPPPEVLALLAATASPANRTVLSAVSLPRPFKCRVSRVADAMVVDVRGEIDLATAPAVEVAIDSVQESTERVVVDFSEVSFLDSSALNVLRDCRRRLAEREVELRVVVPAYRVHVRKVFELTGLIEPLGVVGSLDEALTG
jgi:anti-sigma B factor antagonist